MPTPVDVLSFAGLLVLIVFGAMLLAERRRRRRPWRTVARRMRRRRRSGPPRRSKPIRASFAGADLDVDTVERKGGETWTRYRAQFEPLGLGLRMVRDRSRRIGELLSVRDIEVGDGELDREFTIEGEDPTAIRRFLTPERSLRLLRLVASHQEVHVTDGEAVCFTSGIETNEAHVRRQLTQLGHLVACLTSEPDADRGLEHALAHQRDGELGEAIDAASAVAEDDPDAEVLLGDALYTAGDYGRAAVTLEKVADDAPEDEEARGLAELAREHDGPDEEPEPAGEAPDPGALARELFDPSLMTHQSARLFEERFQGARVRWRGTLQQVRGYRSDLVFGSEPGTRAVLGVAVLDEGGYSAREVQAVVRLEPGAADELRSRTGEELAFEGRLVRCDAFLRNLFVAEGELVDAHG